MNGSISKIPADYTVEVRDLVVGTRYKVEERDYEIPKGYTIRLEDGYTRTDTQPEQMNGTTLVSGTIRVGEDPAIDVRNQKGWGLTVEKIWTDKDFMEQHDPICFAVYVKNGSAEELLPDSVRQLPSTESSLYYFFGNLQSGIPFDNYVIYEVKVSGGTADAGGYVTGYSSVTPIKDGGSLTIGGTPAGGTYQEGKFTYTVTYRKGEQTTQNENVRIDTVTTPVPVSCCTRLTGMERHWLVRCLN